MTRTDLLARLTSGPYWQLVEPDLMDGEHQVHYAHLRCVQGSDEVSGTLFLTSRRLLWRTVDPRRPEGSGFEVGLEDVLGVEQPERFAPFHAFRVVTEDDGRPVDTYFFPHHRSETDQLLCAQMHDVVTDAWHEHRAWGRTA